MIYSKWPYFIVLVLGLSTGSAYAIVNPEKLPQVACSSLTFGDALLAKFPQASDACLDGRIYKGKRYAKFEAKVYISDRAFMTVQILNAAGETVNTFSFKPGPKQRVIVNGREKLFHTLRVGEKITFWVPEGRLEAQELPGPTKDRWTILPPISK